MARKSRSRKHAPAKPTPARPRYAPDWITLGLSAFGMLVTGYLVITTLTTGTPVGCGVGSSCDIVQQSRWSTLLGLPVALWGFGLYLVIALVAGLGRARPKRWQQLWALSFFGLIFSLYLTLVGWLELDALCWWCTLSLATVLALVITLTFRRPGLDEGPFWGNFLLGRGVTVAVLLVALHGIYNGWFEAPADPKLEALAQHLDRTGATFYGAFWCPTCQDQKAIFGAAADDLPYFECSPNGRNAGLAFECASENISNFPTWVIGSRRLDGIQTPEDLARYSRFDWEGWQPPE
ncbi:vitamin K epoxide reductase family protein [Wenzhouxiangella marina]|uniref:Vitamin K epoxide reductase n=1 Tax=Wenzhouxiangella marina TaxID=1579979 RepID=A0A0K0XUR8_9GAMM|nr:vitamin K epoxide reductase family protein [Wenzhouxiangella marina]AKS41410.1 Vitamin K epoxide reductase [Wenzhouxiangella marina]MBB6086836.1 putative membrane protein [Wenzhouxiangella marina]